MKFIMAILVIAMATVLATKAQAVEVETAVAVQSAVPASTDTDETAVRIMRASNAKTSRQCSATERAKAYAWFEARYKGQALMYAKSLYDWGVIDDNNPQPWGPQLITVFYQIYTEVGQRDLATTEGILAERCAAIPAEERVLRVEPVQVKMAPIEVHVAPIEVHVDLTPQPVKVEVVLPTLAPASIYLQPVDTRIPLAFSQGHPYRTHSERSLLSAGQTGVSNIRVSGVSSATTGAINVSVEAAAAASADAAAVAESN